MAGTYPNTRSRSFTFGDSGNGSEELQASTIDSTEVSTPIDNDKRKAVYQMVENMRLKHDKEKAIHEKDLEMALRKKYEGKVRQEMREKLKLKETLEIRNMEIFKLKHHVTTIEREYATLAIRMFEEDEPVDKDNEMGKKIRFERNGTGCIVLDTDRDRMKFIKGLELKGTIEYEEEIKQFFVKDKPDGGQFTFGIFDDPQPVRIGSTCMVCQRKFKADSNGTVIKAPFGIGADNDIPKIIVGPICGGHRSRAEKSITPINFITRKK